MRISYTSFTTIQASNDTIAFMPESDRGRHTITTKIGLEVTIVLRNAAGGKSSIAKRGTSAVVECIEPESGRQIQISATELRILAALQEGMNSEEISKIFGWQSIHMVKNSIVRMRRRFENARWEVEEMRRTDFISIADRLGLLDSVLLDSISKIIHNAPPQLSAAERARRYKARKSVNKD